MASMDSQPSSPTHALILLAPVDRDSPAPAWHPILSVSNQVVLYNPTSHALSVRPHTSLPPSICPYCNRPLQLFPEASPFEMSRHSRAQNYFQLLEVANETSSRPSTPGLRSVSSGSRAPGLRQTRSGDSGRGGVFAAEAMAEGYFSAFFREEYRLGMGANGSVFLCQHVLDGNPLGHFAVKKIAVGQSHSYLLKTLREVHLLESLRHPNIITYHHAWLESCQFSSFGPRVPTLFVLMQWAEGGSLDDFIDARLGRPHTQPRAARDSSETAEPETAPSRSARIRAFRAAQRQPQAERERGQRERAPSSACTTAVHLLSAEEVKRLLEDVVGGLAFLHDRSILHLDLKPGNVLLTWDEGALIPRAMLSDFGTSQDMIQPARQRSGNTGTLEYTAPESLPSPNTGRLAQVDSKADMWSLGMILHKLLFFCLPYRYSSDGDGRSNDGGDMERLEKEVLSYPGFKSSAALRSTFESRGLSPAYLMLLESLLNRTSKMRPSSDRVLRVIREGNLDPIPMRTSRNVGHGTLIPRLSSPSPPEPLTVTKDEEPDDFTPEIQEQDPNATSDHRPAFVDEKTPLLALPSPTPPLTPNPFPSRFRPPLWLWFWSDYGFGTNFVSYHTFVRILKSSILIAKVYTLQSICSDSHPGLVSSCVVLAMAVVDASSESLWVSAAFGILHIVLMKFICIHGSCCNVEVG